MARAMLARMLLLMLFQDFTKFQVRLNADASKEKLGVLPKFNRALKAVMIKFWAVIEVNNSLVKSLVMVVVEGKKRQIYEPLPLISTDNKYWPEMSLGTPPPPPYHKEDEEITIEKTIQKLICQSPITSVKSTSIRKWIYNKLTYNIFILIVLSINIVIEFYSKLYISLNNNHLKKINEIIKASFKDGNLKCLKQLLHHFIRVVITTFSILW